MSKPDSPAPPDYIGAAKAQGQANIDAAVTQAQLNHTNATGPYGTTAWSNPEYDAAVAAYNTPDKAAQRQQVQTLQSQKEALMAQRPAPNLSRKTARWQEQINALDSQISGIEGVIGKAPKAGDYLQGWKNTTTLSPAEQAKLDSQNAVSGKVGQVAQQLAQNNLGQGAISTEGLPDVFQGAQANQQSAADATYESMMRYLNPEFDRQQGALDTKLSNQGLFIGSKGRQNEQNNFTDNRSQAQQDAASKAIIAGLQANNQSFQQNMAARQQGLQERQNAQDAPWKNFATGLGALRSSGEYMTPNVPGQGPQGNAQVGAAPVMEGTQAAGTAALQNYQNQLGTYNSQMSGLGSLASSALMAFMLA